MSITRPFAALVLAMLLSGCADERVVRLEAEIKALKAELSATSASLGQTQRANASAFNGLPEAEDPAAAPESCDCRR